MFRESGARRIQASQQVGNGVAVVVDGQCFVIVAASAADFTLHVNVGQEVHLDAALASPGRLRSDPPATFERRSVRVCTALAGFGQHGVEVANRREDSGIGRRIERARRATDGRLACVMTLSINSDPVMDLWAPGSSRER